MCCGDANFVIYEIWGLQFPRGDFCRLKHSKILNWFQKHNICYFGIKALDVPLTPWFVTKVIKHISVWSHNNQTNIILCNASLHQLSKITEIVTGCRIVARKSSLDGLYVFVGGLGILILTKTQLIYRVSYFMLEGLDLCSGGKAHQTPMATGLGGSRALQFSYRLWMCRYFVESNVQNKINE